ncbi:hypothetical protein [Natronobeatus ordinarius]|uniref:hypothetical protein n=1 Tax=Natronobeatus ordinarius TaxID=2963433 RepID=UPI0020CFDB59|nr:hypothetical protein [Natronobeatus ordinarius]
MTEPDRFRIPVTAGALAGALAWVVGYLVTYVLSLEELEASFAAQGLQLLTDDAAEWRLVGWLFYNAHGVAVRIPRGPFTPFSVNVVDANDGHLSVLFAVPPLLLLAAGALVTWQRRTELRSGADALVSGATVLVGYLPLAIAGVAAVTVTVGGEQLRPDPVTAVFLAGIFYPALFGALGGLLVRLAAGRR